MQTRICLTCRFQASKEVKEKRPCAQCISRSGFSKWECAEKYKSEDNVVV